MNQANALVELLRVREVSPLLQELPDGAVRDLASASIGHRNPAGTFLFRQGEAAGLLHLVTSGSVLSYRIIHNGKRTMLNLARAGDAIGLQCLIRHAGFFTAEALEDSVSMAWDGKTIERLLQAYPRLAVNTLRSTVTSIVELSEMYSELLCEPAEQRLAKTLQRLGRKLGTEVQGSVRIAGLSQEEVGAMAGLSLFTTNRIVGKWRRQRIIRTGRCHILVLRQDRLEEVAAKYPEERPRHHGTTMRDVAD